MYVSNTDEKRISTARQAHLRLPKECGFGEIDMKYPILLAGFLAVMSPAAAVAIGTCDCTGGHCSLYVGDAADTEDQYRDGWVEVSDCDEEQYPTIKLTANGHDLVQGSQQGLFGMAIFFPGFGRLPEGTPGGGRASR